MGAVGAGGFAAAAAVEDEPVGKQGPVVLRDEFHEDGLDFFWVGLAGEAEAGGEARDVGVDDDADVLAEGVAEDDVGGFAADAGELDEFVHGLRDVSAMLVDEEPAAGADVFGLGAVEADGAEVVLEGGGIGLGVVARGAVFFEEGGGDFIDLHVGALRGEDGGDEEFEGIGEGEFAVGVGVDAGEDFAEGSGALGGGELFHVGAKDHKGGGNRRKNCPFYSLL